MRPTVLGLLLLSSSAAAADKIEFTFGGQVQYDLRFRVQDVDYGTFYRDVEDPPMLARNELFSKFRVGAKLGNFGARTDIDLVLRGYPKVQDLTGLSVYNDVTPFRIEAHEAYLYATTRFLDVRIGQQKALFGMGDQFNPTNNVNPNDVEDVLLFGEQIGNLMVRLDAYPAWNWQLTGILVPVFKPALLPRTGYLAQTPDRYPFLNAEARENFGAEQASGERLFGYPTVVNSVTVTQPDFHPKNMQAFFRVGAQLGGQDLALSYYRGFSDIPQPVRNVTGQREYDEPVCDGDPEADDTTCYQGELPSDVTLAYPRMQVLGFNASGEFDAFGWLHKSFKPIGYRFELAMVFPEETRLDVIQDDIQFGFVTKDGPYVFPDDDNRVVGSKPFPKWVFGLDYTFNKHLYMNTQWVHGFPDEFGAGSWVQPGEGTVTRASWVPDDAVLANCLDLSTFSGRGEQCYAEYTRPRIGDYLVVGLDVNFLSSSALFRLFTIWDLVGVTEHTWDEASGERIATRHGMFSEKGFNAVIYPSFSYNFGNGLEVEAGGLVYLGKPWTKFGAPENGGTLVWTRARYSF